MSKRVVIIGAGVVGLSVAFHAARKGHVVTVIERGTAEGDGCSFGNAGMVVPSHFVPLAAPGMMARALRWMWSPESPFYVRPRLSADLLGWGWRFWRAANARAVADAAPLLRDLHMASRKCFEEWAGSWDDDLGLVKRGLLMLCNTARGLEEEAETAEQARALGVPAEVLTPREAAEREPNLRMEIVGAVHFPLDCHLSPGRLMAALARETQKAGARLCWGTKVIGWRRHGPSVEAVLTDHDDVTADEYVLCAGIWSTALARDLGLRLPMQAGKGYSLTLPEPRRLPSLGAILTEARVAVTPMGSALRVGGTMELTGLDESIDAARVRGIVNAVARYYPEFAASDFARVPAWCGLRPCSPDGIPYVGRFERYRNLSAATGHAMMGVSLGPITGKLMAEILSDEKPSLDIAALRPDRYA
jgi:D-amino-acid dehydrogenase